MGYEDPGLDDASGTHVPTNVREQTCLHGQPYTQVKMSASGITMGLCGKCLEKLKGTHNAAGSDAGTTL